MNRYLVEIISHNQGDVTTWLARVDGEFCVVCTSGLAFAFDDVEAARTAARTFRLQNPDAIKTWIVKQAVDPQLPAE